jgi:hypothetical protein
VVRRFARFSDAVESVWSERRRLTKRYDSIQWQKLLWIGIGLTARLGQTGDIEGFRVSLAVICVLSGAAGLTMRQSNRHRQNLSVTKQ